MNTEKNFKFFFNLFQKNAFKFASKIEYAHESIQFLYYIFELSTFCI